MSKHVHVHIYDAGWDESKHPRAKDGKFGTGAGSSSGRPSGKKYDKETRLRAERHLAVIPKSADGKIDTSLLFKHPEADPMEMAEAEGERKGKPQTREEVISLEDLVPTQEYVTRAGIWSYLNNVGRGEGEIAVHEMGGKLLLMDGHHRVSAMMLAGIKRANLKVTRRR
jgi:hypothetical protein